MSEKIKLALCPFCGGKAELMHVGNIGLADKPRLSYVRCTKCLTTSKSFEISTEYSSDELAIDRWNSRAPITLDACYKYEVLAALRKWFNDNTDDRNIEEVVESIPNIKFIPIGVCY